MSAPNCQESLKLLAEAVDNALGDLECIELNCWCFTRAAMLKDPCKCSNCDVWRKLSAAFNKADVVIK